jgi:hypothetical protein
MAGKPKDNSECHNNVNLLVPGRHSHFFTSINFSLAVLAFLGYSNCRHLVVTSTAITKVPPILQSGDGFAGTAPHRLKCSGSP